ncbi:MAG: protein translocase SEC61 complex subunit gamma [Candidatus Aenigmatarchaeota archaeon]|nr:MAG: protein translocase SEC61 complex subunit gamma [Candidatus Aenigmarchaeota archaeon]
MKKKLKTFLKQCKRILAIATKPGKDEYFNYSKIIAIGVLALGLFGFIFYLIFSYLGV